jgi:class 3 adenylate cyclase
MKPQKQRIFNGLIFFIFLFAIYFIAKVLGFYKISYLKILYILVIWIMSIVLLYLPRIFFTINRPHSWPYYYIWTIPLYMLTISLMSFIHPQGITIIVFFLIMATTYTSINAPSIPTIVFGLSNILSLLFTFYINDSMQYIKSEHYIILSSTCILILGVGYVSNIISTSKNNLLKEKSKSENLLLNILPKDVADELKEKGYNEPVYYKAATVLFTDFQGFTQIAEKMSPKELVTELDRCFSYFDSLMERYNLEKLKTIGDSFMCAGGIPVENNTHAIDCVLAALEIQSFMNQMRELRIQKRLDYWELRLGINSGSLVAGVIGEKKFAYDIWSDTVNTASRCESSGVAGRINISGNTFNLVKSFFECEYRGKVSAKHKGEIDMYFVNGIKKEYSVVGEGRVPNNRFNEKYGELKEASMV